MASTGSSGRDQWVDAAYHRFGAEGLSAVRVEALARDLGTTKGSFYWHFADRAALVDAVMVRWEAEETDRLIAIAEAAGSPAEKLRGLFSAVASRVSAREGERTLYAAEGVHDAVARVTRRRIDYVAGLLRDLGFDEAEAERRSTIALASVIGLQQLMHGAGVIPGGLTETAYRMTVNGP